MSNKETTEIQAETWANYYYQIAFPGGVTINYSTNARSREEADEKAKKANNGWATIHFIECK